MLILGCCYSGLDQLLQDKDRVSYLVLYLVLLLLAAGSTFAFFAFWRRSLWEFIGFQVVITRTTGTMVAFHMSILLLPVR